MIHDFDTFCVNSTNAHVVGLDDNDIATNCEFYDELTGKCTKCRSTFYLNLVTNTCVSSCSTNTN